MSTGGVFKLIADAGKQDRMMMATELLNQRIRDIMSGRKSETIEKWWILGQADVVTVRDIMWEIGRVMETVRKMPVPPTLAPNILFVNTSFRPFMSIGYGDGTKK
jgi:hypothetical protein